MRNLMVYIVNVKNKVDGNYFGKWFSIPILEQRVLSELKASSFSEDCMIFDYIFPIDICNDISLQNLNEIGKILLNIPDNVYYILDILLENWFSSIFELYKNIGNIVLHDECKSMIEFAYVETVFMHKYGEIPSKLIEFIDYENLGKTIQNSGTYLVTEHGICEFKKKN